MFYHLELGAHVPVLYLILGKEPGSLCVWERTKNRAENVNTYSSSESFTITGTEDKNLKI